MTEKTGRATSGATLEAAMALLLNNQAALVAQNTLFLSEMAKAHQEFLKIRQELETIKALLVRHETMLERLPEAIREKIGFKN
jgi:hypothetical protein